MDGLKQRIIGALVLVSLAVIFVPMVFDEPHSERTSTQIKIPEEPPFPEVNAPEADSPMPPAYDESAQAPQPDLSESPSEAGQEQPGYRLVEEDSEPFSGAPEQDAGSQPEAQSQPKAVEKPVENSQSSPVATTSEPEADAGSAEFTRSLEGAWVVQLGSFGNTDNARRLRDKVREKGYGSHLQQVERGDTTLTRVFSGPFANKADAEAAKKVLDEAFSLNSLVTSGDR